MLRGLHFILFEKTNTPCNIGESYRCGIGNPYRAASIHHYQRIVHVRTCCVVYIIFGSLPNAINMYWVSEQMNQLSKLSRFLNLFVVFFKVIYEVIN